MFVLSLGWPRTQKSQSPVCTGKLALWPHYLLGGGNEQSKLPCFAGAFIFAFREDDAKRFFRYHEMSNPLCVEITHVSFQGNSIAEVGAVRNGTLLWREPVAAVIGMYRAGARFFIKLASGRAVEVFLDDRMHTNEVELRTPADKITMPVLKSLPVFPA